MRVLRQPEFLDGGTDTAYPRPARRGLRPTGFARRSGWPSSRRRLPARPGLTATRLGRLPGRLAQRARRCPVGTSSGSGDSVVEVAHTLDRTARLVDGPDGVVARAVAPDAVTLRGRRGRPHVPRPRRRGCLLRGRTRRFAGRGRRSRGSPRRRSSRRPARCSRRCRAQSAGSLVEPGQRVARGDLLLTLEAMKLEHAVRAPEAGVVADLPGRARRPGGHRRRPGRVARTDRRTGRDRHARPRPEEPA